MQQVYRRGDTGPVVAEICSRLVTLGMLDPGDATREVFDDRVDRAVRYFQQARSANVDGMVGPQTWRLLDEARWSLGDRVLYHAVGHLLIGDDIAALQQRLLDMGFDSGRADGIFGAQTDRALRDFQRNVGLADDGVCGPTTFKALNRLNRTVTGGTPQALREAEVIRRAGPTLVGKIVVIDPGHGGLDTGQVGGGLTEAWVASDLAARIEGRLGALGVTAYLTRGLVAEDENPPDEAARADFANTTRADLVLSLHTDGSSDPRASGVATYFYGAGGGVSHSAVGEAFAGLVQREIVARTDLLDCRTHGKTWDLLRRTRMAAVRLEARLPDQPRRRRAAGRPGLPRQRRRGGHGRGATPVPAARRRPPHRGPPVARARRLIGRAQPSLSPIRRCSAASGAGAHQFQSPARRMNAGHQEPPHHRRVQQDREGDAEAQLLDGRDAAGDERGEDDGQQDRGGSDDAAGALQAQLDGRPRSSRPASCSSLIRDSRKTS